jgi:uncharacterized membrane protein YkvI
MAIMTLRVLFNSIPMIVFKMIFLLERKVEKPLDVTSFLLSVILSIITSIIYGFVFLKKYEEYRYHFQRKISFLCGCMSYIRLDIEEFLAKIYP